MQSTLGVFALQSNKTQIWSVLISHIQTTNLFLFNLKNIIYDD